MNAAKSLKRLTALLLIPILVPGPRPLYAAAGSPPLAEAVSTAVRDCGSPGTLQVPLITWGGDIPTVHANGGQADTRPGSIFAKQGLSLRLAREDAFQKQVEAYLRCDSPFLRGTAGMIGMASEAANKDPRTKLVVVYQLTWSAGGDALVVKSGIGSPRDLKGKTIAVQAYGPHVDYLAKILADSGLSLSDVRVRWTKDLTGAEDTPVNALSKDGVDASMVIIPDALALTSGGKVGTGAEDSVRGARILLTTKSANRIIADLYAVRADYFNKNRDQVQRFVRGLMLAEEESAALFKDGAKGGADYKNLLRAAGRLLMDSPDATKDVEGMYADAEFAGWGGNRKFFGDRNYPRNFDRLTAEIQAGLLPLGLVGRKQSIESASWNYDAMKAGLKDTRTVEAPRFDKTQVARVVSRKQKQGTLDQSGLFTFEVFFKPNQSDFPEGLYADSFTRAINLAATYGGAILTVEGHSDPLGYLRKVQKREPVVVLNRVRQAARNLSLARANAVRDSLVSYAKNRGISLDASQFAVVGHGITKPRSGMCGQEPCAPKNEQQWLDNMRVEFRIVQVEAEESVFKPL